MRPNHQHFDDMVPLQKHQFPHKVSRIVVQHSKEHLVGVHFEYRCGPHHHEVCGESSTKFEPI